jgi:oligoribonuclease (3'-5' exoribonuclease)
VKRRRFTTSERSCEFPQISNIFLYEIITVRPDYHRFCTRWVPKMLMGVHKKHKIASALTFYSNATRMATNFSITLYE